MMPTKVVSFREDEEVLRFVREQGLSPSKVAKEAFDQRIQRMRRRTEEQWLDGFIGSQPGLGRFERDRKDRL